MGRYRVPVLVLSAVAVLAGLAGMVTARSSDRGEIVGLSGLVGSGRTEVARLLFGADPRDAGEIELDGRPLRIRHPRYAIAAGLAVFFRDSIVANAERVEES